MKNSPWASSVSCLSLRQETRSLLGAHAQEQQNEEPPPPPPPPPPQDEQEQEDEKEKDEEEEEEEDEEDVGSLHPSLPLLSALGLTHMPDYTRGAQMLVLLAKPGVLPPADFRLNNDRTAVCKPAMSHRPAPPCVPAYEPQGGGCAQGRTCRGRVQIRPIRRRRVCGSVCNVKSYVC